MKHVLVFEEDPETYGCISGALNRASLGADRAHTALAACRRICSLPTLDAMVIDITSGQTGPGLEVAQFARQVVPEILVIYVARDADGTSAIALSHPDGELAPSFPPQQLTGLGLQPPSLKGPRHEP